MTTDPAESIIGAVGTTASISVGLIGAGMVIKQVKSLERTTTPRRRKKAKKGRR